METCHCLRSIRTSFGDAATGVLNETNEIGNLRRVSDLFVNSFEGLSSIELCGKQQMKGVVKRVDCGARIAAPFHSGDIQAVATRMIANRKSERQCVFNNYGVTTDV